MDSDAKIIIAFLFKRSGKNELKESDIYLPLSIDLGWFPTKESHDFVDYVVKQKLLIKKEGALTPSFDIEKINIPVGFYPSKKSFIEEKIDLKEEKKNVTDIIVQQISEKTNQDTKDVAEEIKKTKLEKNILPEVAALLIARRYSIDIKDSFEIVEDKILRESGE